VAPSRYFSVPEGLVVGGALPDVPLVSEPRQPLSVLPVVPEPELPLVAFPLCVASPEVPAEPVMFPGCCEEPLIPELEPEVEPEEPVPPIELPASIFTATLRPWSSL
jgi:hypothetical protein